MTSLSDAVMGFRLTNPMFDQYITTMERWEATIANKPFIVARDGDTTAYFQRAGTFPTSGANTGALVPNPNVPFVPAKPSVTSSSAGVPQIFGQAFTGIVEAPGKALTGAASFASDQFTKLLIFGILALIILILIKKMKLVRNGNEKRIR